MFPGVLALLVAIEVSGPGLPAEQRLALESACSQALGGRCVVGGLHLAEAPDAVAVIALDAEVLHAQVEVGRRRNERRIWLARELTFEPEDALAERFRALGLTVATLVGDVQEREEQEQKARDQATADKAPAPPPPAAPAAVARETAVERREQPVGDLLPLASIGVLAGPGLEEGWVRSGGFVRSSLRVGTFFLWPTLWFSYALRPADSDGLSATWFTTSAGVVTAAEWGRLDLSTRFRLEGAVERFAVEQTLAPVDSGSRWVPGIRAGADAAWPASGALAAVLGADLWVFQSGTRLIVAGRETARAPSRNFTLSLGVELRLH
jgi:hypothetical protein